VPSLPAEMIVLLAPFVQLFSERVWFHAQGLVVGAILAPGPTSRHKLFTSHGAGRRAALHQLSPGVEPGSVGDAAGP
jgi:hypothetical protein